MPMKPVWTIEPTCVVTTPGALAALGEDANTRILHLLARHFQGDWGIVCEEDQAFNNSALKGVDRVLSAYPINEDLPCKGYGENTVWIITEADRSVTTVLLPEEY